MSTRRSIGFLLILCIALLCVLTALVSGYPVNSDVTDADTLAKEVECLLALLSQPLTDELPDTVLPLVQLHFGDALSPEASWLPARITVTCDGFADADRPGRVFLPDGETPPSDEERSYRLTLLQITRKGRLKPDDAGLLGLSETSEWLLSYSTPDGLPSGAEGRDVRLVIGGRDAGVYRLTPLPEEDAAAGVIPQLSEEDYDED